MTPGELKAALQLAPEWLRAPMSFAACTGVRGGELFSLRWMDVDKGKLRVYFRETKNGALCILRLSVKALTVLGSLSHGAEEDTVFAGVDAARLSVYAKRIFAGLDIADASFHTLRHRAASWLVQNGVGLYAVGNLLGHKTARMTQRYTRIFPPKYGGCGRQIGWHYGRNAG